MERRSRLLWALRSHWPEYFIEAALLGLFMISASAFTILLEYPGSPAVAVLPDAFVRRMFIGVAMGLTALTLILSPLGRRSGAHFNPAVTLTFWQLGKVQMWDAIFYIAAQFLGAIAGVALVTTIVPRWLADASVNYVATQPCAAGVAAAFAAEFVISFMLMTTILKVSNHPRLTRFTPFFAATLVAAFITFEAPLSGMSMNPARTFGSAFVGQIWTALWIYFTAPVLAMQLAALVYRRAGRVVYCAKLHHHNGARCIFNCSFGELQSGKSRSPKSAAEAILESFCKESAPKTTTDHNTLMKTARFLALSLTLLISVPATRAENPADFSVESALDGSKFQLSKNRGKIIALHFLLKTECPFCLRHTHDYAALAATTPEVLHIFLKPDSDAEIKSWAGKIRKDDLKDTPVIYRDPNAKLAKQFGIPDGYKFHGQTVHFPALVVLNGNGKELFRYVGKSNSNRMSTSDFTAKLAEVTGKH